MITAHERHCKTAVVLCSLSELMPEKTRKRLLAARIAPLQGLEAGVAALASLVWYSQRRREIHRLG